MTTQTATELTHKKCQPCEGGVEPVSPREAQEQLVKINTWHIELFGRFLDRLAKTPDGDGSLLDHSLILYGSGMSDSNSHSALDVPLLLAGKAGGKMTGDRHLAAPKGTQLANAKLDLAQKFGAEVDQFGVSTGRYAL